MPTVSIDHIAMPTANAERLIAFTNALVFPSTMKSLACRYRANVLHPGRRMLQDQRDIPRLYRLVARADSRASCGDICFVWEGTVEECRNMLEEAGWRLSPARGGVPAGVAVA